MFQCPLEVLVQKVQKICASGLPYSDLDHKCVLQSLTC